jgi:hypothetical protein
MDLIQIVSDIGAALASVDKSGEPFRSFQPGVGPYGEPQLVKLIASYLNGLPEYRTSVRTKRTPDLLIPNEWAVEFKIARPYGDNGKEAENWSVNLLHPYPGNVSTLGDCYKLRGIPGLEQKAVVVIGYEHSPPKISLTPLVEAFEAVAKYVAGVELSARLEVRVENLIHPVHQSARVFAWQLQEGDG